MLEAKIYVMLKETIADPQGAAVKHALESLRYSEIQDVRIGKLITLKIKSNNKKRTSERVDKMCKKLLANPIVEDYSYEIKKI